MARPKQRRQVTVDGKEWTVRISSNKPGDYTGEVVEFENAPYAPPFVPCVVTGGNIREVLESAIGAITARLHKGPQDAENPPESDEHSGSHPSEGEAAEDSEPGDAPTPPVTSVTP